MVSRRALGRPIEGFFDRARQLKKLGNGLTLPILRVTLRRGDRWRAMGCGVIRQGFEKSRFVAIPTGVLCRHYRPCLAIRSQAQSRSGVRLGQRDAVAEVGAHG